MKIKLTESQYKKVLIEQGATVTTSPGTKPYTGTYDTSVDNISGDKGITDAIDALQHILDWAGLIPIYGDALDFVNAVIYFLRDKKLEGILSVIAIIPVVGSIIAIPFKLIFKLIPTKWVIKIMEFIVSGGKIGGKAITEGFIKIAGEKAPEQMEIVLSTLNKNLDTIKPAIDKLNAPFAYIEKLNHKLIPDYIGNLARKGAKKGSAVAKGIKNWLFGVGDSVEAKTIVEAQKLYKKAFIDATSPEEWQLQVKKLLSGDGDKAAKKQEFIEAVSNPKKAIVKTVVGVKIPDSERHIIEAALQSKGFKKSWGVNENGELISVPLKIDNKIIHLSVNSYRPSMLDIKKFSETKLYSKILFDWTLKGNSGSLWSNTSVALKFIKKYKNEIPKEMFFKQPLGPDTSGIHIDEAFDIIDNKEWVIIKPGKDLNSWEEIKWVIEHEITHVKQPIQVSPLSDAKYMAIGASELSVDDAIKALNLTIEKPIPKDQIVWTAKKIKKFKTVSVFSKKEKANALRLRYKHWFPESKYNLRIGHPSLSKLSKMSDDEIINYFIRNKEGMGYEKVIIDSSVILRYLFHRKEIEAEFTPFIQTIIRNGQQEEYKGFVTWMEDFLKKSNKTEIIKSGDNPWSEMFSERFWNTLKKIEQSGEIYPKQTKKLFNDMWKQLSELKKSGYHESIKRKMKIILTEEQYNRVLLREFGETIRDPKEWYLRVLEWVDSPEDLDFERSEDEVVVYDTYGSYLGYYDKESELGFVVTEYGIGLEDEGEEDEYIDEQDDAGDTGGDTGGGTGTKWEDIVSLTRGPANTLDNTPWSLSPARGPDNTLDNSPWPDSLTRGAANQLS